MSARYEKTIVIEEEGKVKAMVIYDQGTRTPVFHSVNKLGMDDILDLFGGVKDADVVAGSTHKLQNPAIKN